MRTSALLGLLWLGTTGAQLQAQNKSFVAISDARVRQDAREVNFGTEELGVECSLRAPSRLFERSYLRFRVTGVLPEEVDCISLRLKVISSGDCHFEVRRVSGSWSEETLTWNSRPDANTLRVGAWSGTGLSEGEVVYVPLGKHLFANGSGTYDLALVETLGGGETRIAFDSREGSAPPRLVFGCTGLPARAGFAVRRTENEVPFTPIIQAYLPDDVTSATWDFGDGSPPQVALAPSHTYTTPGRFDVSVTATGPSGSVSVTRPGYLFAHRPDEVAGSLVRFDEVNDVTGGSLLDLMDEDYFGRAVGAIGDLDGDGVIDLIVGAVGDDQAEDRAGAVYILFMNSDGTLKDLTKITEGHNGFEGDLDVFDGFGREVAPIGDLDGDGVLDVAVGSNGDDDAGMNSGAVWILYLNTDGSVKSSAKITGLVSSTLDVHQFDEFGRGIACIGDLNGDGVQDLAVGAIGDDSGGINYGCVWIILMNRDGSVLNARRISSADGGLSSVPVPSSLGWWFGLSVAPIGDVNGDGICDIVVGAILDNAVPMSSGAAIVILLNSNGTVLSDVLINALQGGLDHGEVWVNDQFGGAVAGIGDLDADGVPDIAVSSFYDDDNPDFGTDLYEETGALYVLFLNDDGSVRDYQKLSATRGVISPGNMRADRMGEGLAGLGDLDGDGSPELLVGSRFDDDGGPNRGNVRIMHLSRGEQPLPANIIELGCGVNTPQSLRILAGNGRIGTQLSFGVDNPLGTQAPGARPFVSFNNAPDPNFPCGTLVPGRGMDGGAGELLIQINPPPFRIVAGPPWSGAGKPSPVLLGIPTNTALIGFKLYAQGRIVDSTPGAPVRLGFTGAFEITLLP